MNGACDLVFFLKCVLVLMRRFQSWKHGFFLYEVRLRPSSLDLRKKILWITLIVAKHFVVLGVLRSFLRAVYVYRVQYNDSVLYFKIFACS